MTRGFCFFFFRGVGGSGGFFGIHRLLEPDQVSHTQSMVAKIGHTNWANVHTRRPDRPSFLGKGHLYEEFVNFYWDF